jgi:peptidyl-prolyl isomerase E (cyclophilin E)
MNVFVFCGGLEETVTKDIIQSLFIPFGEILDIQTPLNPETGKNRGFAVIEFEVLEDGEAAIDNMNNSEYNGKVLTVHVAKNEE